MDMLENASIELDERAEVANVADQAMVVNPQNNGNTAPENPTVTLFAKHFNNRVIWHALASFPF